MVDRIQPGLPGDFAQTRIDTRRGRFVTPKNVGDKYTPRERETAMDAFWDEHIGERFAEAMQGYLDSPVSLRPADQGISISAELDRDSLLEGLGRAFDEAKGKPITAAELTKRILKESQALEARASRTRVARPFASMVVDKLADSWGLVSTTKAELRRTIFQPKLPQL